MARNKYKVVKVKHKIHSTEVPVKFKKKSIIDRTVSFKNLLEVILMYLLTFFEIKIFKRRKYNQNAKSIFMSLILNTLYIVTSTILLKIFFLKIIKIKRENWVYLTILLYLLSSFIIFIIEI